MVPLRSFSTTATVLLAAILGGFTTWLFFPGLMSFDSIYLYRQVIGETPVSNYHPPIMVYAWKLGHGLLGPGSMLIFHQAMYWTAVAVIALCIHPGWLVRCLVVLALGLLPPLWVHSATVWNDVGVMSSFLLAVACSLSLKKTGSKWLLAVGMIALLYGLSAKRTGIPAAIPLFFLLADAWRNAGPLNRRRGFHDWLKTAVVGLGLMIPVMAVSTLVGTVGIEKVTKWPTVAVWDIAAVSLAEDRVLFPVSVLNRKDESEAETLARLHDAFSPEVNGPLVNVVSMFPADEYHQELFAAWRALPTKYPASYFDHRLEVFARVLGFWPHPVHLAFEHRIIPNEVGLRLLNKESRPLQLAISWLARSVETPVYRSWIYLTILVLITVFALFRVYRGNTFDGRALVYLGLSGLLYVLPLFLIAPAADFRYTLWMVACSAVMIFFAVFRLGKAPGLHRRSLS